VVSGLLKPEVKRAEDLSDISGPRIDSALSEIKSKVFLGRSTTRSKIRLKLACQRFKVEQIVQTASLLCTRL